VTPNYLLLTLVNILEGSLIYMYLFFEKCIPTCIFRNRKNNRCDKYIYIYILEQVDYKLVNGVNILKDSHTYIIFCLNTVQPYFSGTRITIALTSKKKIIYKYLNSNFGGGCHDRDRMVVGFTTTYAISAYHH